MWRLFSSTNRSPSIWIPQEAALQLCIDFHFFHLPFHHTIINPPHSTQSSTLKIRQFSLNPSKCHAPPAAELAQHRVQQLHQLDPRLPSSSLVRMGLLLIRRLRLLNRRNRRLSRDRVRGCLGRWLALLRKFILFLDGGWRMEMGVARGVVDRGGW
jgi:hypothetical protein